MANRFTEYNPKERVSNYVPLPLEAMGQMLSMKQSQFDTALNDADKIEEDVLKVNAIDAHKGFKKQLVDSTNARVEKLVDEIIKTGDTSKSRGLKRIARDWQNNPLRTELETSYANYSEYQKDKIKKAEKYGEYYDNYLGFKGSNSDNSIQGYRYTGMGEKQDHQKLASEMMDKVLEDGKSYDNAIIDPKTGNILGYKGGVKQISDAKIRSLAQSKIPSFVQTKEGQDFIQQYKYYNPKGDVTKAVEDYLYTAGNNQIHKYIESGNSIDYSPWAKDDHDNQSVIPVYEAPQSAIKGVDYGKAFSIKNIGDNIPYTKEEAEAITDAYTKSGTGDAGGSIGLMNVLKTGKTNNKVGFTQPSELANNERKFLTSIANFVDKSLANKISSGKKLNDQELNRLYPIANQMAETVKKDVEVNSRIVGMTTKESEQITSSLFGKNDPTVKNLGSGNAGNLKFYDKESNKVMTYKDLKTTLNDDDIISLNGKFTAENPYSLLTGDDSFKNPTQAFIGGKEYIISGPKAYITSDTQDANNPKQELLKRNNYITDIYQSKFSPVPVELDVHSKKVQVYFERSSENPTEGLYKVNYNGQTIQSKEASKIEQFLYNEGKS